jgi:hypothetical protein
MVQFIPPGMIVLGLMNNGVVHAYNNLSEVSTGTSSTFSVKDWRLTTFWSIGSIMSNKLIPISAHLGKETNLSYIADGRLFEQGMVVYRNDNIPAKKSIFATGMNATCGYPIISPISWAELNGERHRLVNKQDPSRPVFLVQGLKLVTNIRYLAIKSVILPSELTGIGIRNNQEVKTWILIP